MVPTQVQTSFQFNPEQQAAIQEISNWMSKSPEPFFLLSGAAGTGKTHCIKRLASSIRGKIVFTAPTNKATKVIRESVTTDDYKPECRTIYSLLGLRMEANGEVKELKEPDDPIDLSQFRLVIIDEASMVNAQLYIFIQKAARDYGIKFLFIGDAAQLPPVGEVTSNVWQITEKATLLTVMRHDNAILELATRIRKQVDSFSPTIRLETSNNGEEGVWKMATGHFFQAIKEDAESGQFSKADSSKVICWRNVQVDKYNKLIRDTIFPGATSSWLVGDRVLFAAPARTLDDEPMAFTDDEGVITRVEMDWSFSYPDMKVWRIAITFDDNRTAQAVVLHEDSRTAYERKVEELLAFAKSNSRKWKDFWTFKEAFHQLKYAYAITAHRSQGSTYDTAYVNWQDILLNRNRQEAYRCLYVACTRPKRALVLG